LLYKLSKFAQWPNLSGQVFRLCVYGNTPFSKSLERLQTKAIKKRPIKLLQLKRINNELKNCDTLFITRSAASHLRRVLIAVSHSPVLTISDITQFADFGGMIELSTHDQHIRFRINLQATRNAKIQLASPLLELATIVSPGQGQ